MGLADRDVELEEKFAAVPPGERILLLPHCLRPSDACPAKYTKEGLNCLPDCPLRGSCPIGKLLEEARALGYKGACVAPGGALAIRFVKEKEPKAILAIACHKELIEGMEAVSGFPGRRPIVLPLPLLRDGCVDTEVDVEEALRLLRLGTDGGSR